MTRLGSSGGRDEQAAMMVDVYRGADMLRRRTRATCERRSLSGYAAPQPSAFPAGSLKRPAQIKLHNLLPGFNWKRARRGRRPHHAVVASDRGGRRQPSTHVAEIRSSLVPNAAPSVRPQYNDSTRLQLAVVAHGQSTNARS